MGKADYPAIVGLVEVFSDEGRDLYRVLLDVERLVREALMEAIQGKGSSERLGALLSSESLMRMLEALQQSEAALQKGLSEKVNFEVALLRAVEASQTRALDNLVRELRNLEDGGTSEKKKGLIPPERKELTPIYLPVENEIPAGPNPDSAGEEEEIIEPEEDPSPPELPSPIVEEITHIESPPTTALEEAIRQVPVELRKEMEELLRADFSEVIRWKP
jgi:hypothetical protein